MLTPKRMITALLSGLLAAGIAQAQICDSAMTRKAPDSRYNLQADGAEVLDTQTGLIWRRCSLGQSWNGSVCAGSAGAYSWPSALQAVHNLGNSWRMPNVKELLSLVEEACAGSAINETLFPATVSDSYWSSSPDANGGDHVRCVSFKDGRSYSCFSWGGRTQLYVRVVRSSQ